MASTDQPPSLSDEQRQHIYEEERRRRIASTPLGRLAGMRRSWQVLFGASLVLLVIAASALVTRAIVQPQQDAMRGWTPRDQDLLADEEMSTAAPSARGGKDGAATNGPRFAEVEGNPAKFAGTKILWRGRVQGVITPQDRGGIGFLVQDPETERFFSARWYSAPKDHGIKDGTWVAVSGTIRGLFETTNNFGGPFRAPDTDIERTAIITRAQAVAPAARTVDINKKDSQHGLTITLQKIEIARSETRVYVRLQNEDSATMTLFKHNTKLIQGKRQFEPEYAFDAEEEQPQDVVLPGAETEGYIIFPPIEAEPKDLRLFLGEPYSGNNHEFRDFDFAFSI